MWTLPRDFRPEIFVGRRLDQISIAEFTIFLVFEIDLEVVVESSLAYTSPDGQTAESAAVPNVTPNMLSLVGKDVSASRVVGDASLEFSFANGAKLIVVAEENGYESYQILTGSRTIVV